MLSPVVDHTSIWEGFALGKRDRFDVTVRSDKSHKQRQVQPRSGPSKREHTRAKDSEYWANIEKRNQINTKNYCVQRKNVDVERREREETRKWRKRGSILRQQRLASPTTLGAFQLPLSLSLSLSSLVRVIVGRCVRVDSGNPGHLVVEKELTAWWKSKIHTQFPLWLRSSVVRACD